MASGFCRIRWKKAIKLPLLSQNMDQVIIKNQTLFCVVCKIQSLGSAPTSAAALSFRMSTPLLTRLAMPPPQPTAMLLLLQIARLAPPGLRPQGARRPPLRFPEQNPCLFRWTAKPPFMAHLALLRRQGARRPPLMTHLGLSLSCDEVKECHPRLRINRHQCLYLYVIFWQESSVVSYLDINWKCFLKTDIIRIIIERNFLTFFQM